MEGSKEQNGTVFKAFVKSQTADLQELNTLTPSDTTAPTIPSSATSITSWDCRVGNWPPDQRKMHHLQRNISTTMGHRFKIHRLPYSEAGGLVEYTGMRSGDMISEFSACITSLFQFSSNILMNSELRTLWNEVGHCAGSNSY